jgi:hypothetical protein
VLSTLTVTDPQLSEACGVPKLQALPAAALCITGVMVSEGAIVSRAVIVCTRFVLLPQESLAVHVREIITAPELVVVESV